MVARKVKTHQSKWRVRRGKTGRLQIIRSNLCETCGETLNFTEYQYHNNCRPLYYVNSIKTGSYLDNLPRDVVHYLADRFGELFDIKIENIEIRDQSIMFRLIIIVEKIEIFYAIHWNLDTIENLYTEIQKFKNYEVNTCKYTNYHPFNNEPVFRWINNKLEITNYGQMCTILLNPEKIEKIDKFLNQSLSLIQDTIRSNKNPI